MAPAKPVSEINIKYGKVMRTSDTNRSNFSGVRKKPEPNAKAITGAPTTDNTVINSNTEPRQPATWSTSAFKAAWEPFARYSANTGTKAWENAPSENSRRKKLGILKAW